MPIASPKQERAGGDDYEAAPRVVPERERLPVATVHLVPYAIDEVEWQVSDDEQRLR